ncbi:peroxiredoxin [Sphingomonas baiyangensis]|uniref:thioredoxin-dependent peroxiredoxin n=1 Tax=Sphingomonas baiyangensis TaxID=2572576 RepID=A0A4V5PX30_9SPHN|nr:peroxiredoxin [Sphingomonas baiyangensis]TKD53208.1 peroxiredoxin [Sphingomonas baiyangensis]
MRTYAAIPLIAAFVAAALPASAALAPGARAPDFTAPGAMAGKPVRFSLSQALRRGPVVLYFFPAAFTSGCNAEAKAFADAVPQFRAAGATVIGMSADDQAQLEKFSSEHCAGKFAVASATPALMKQYDVLLDRPNLPRAMSDRTSYVIAPSGRIAYAHSDMSPVAHVRNTLDAVRKLKAGAQ